RGVGFLLPTPEGPKLGFGLELGRQPPFYYVLPAALGPLAPDTILARLLAMRLGSAALGLGVVLLGIVAGRAAFPPGFARSALPAIAALTPGFVFIAASVNNDNLANLGGAIAFLGLVAIARGRLD